MGDDGGYVFENEYRVRYHDCGPDFQLSVAGALRYFEELALLQSDSLGVGFAWYHSEQVTWILKRWDVRFHSLPRIGDRITALTQPAQYRGFTADRRFEINGPDGTRHIDALSRWVFLDVARMRPKRVSPELATAYGMTCAVGTLPWDCEATEPVAGETGPSLVVRPGDIDYNGHLNNIRYVEWARFARPEETRRLERLLVTYKAETRLGAELRVVTECDGPVTRQLLREDDRVTALVTTHWADA